MQSWERYTTVFKALSDLTRLKIIWLLLSIDSKISVSEIIDVLEESPYNVSKHLRVLKNAGIIYEKKEGKWSFYQYRNNDDEFDKAIKETVLTIPKDMMLNEEKRCQKRLAMRVDGKCVLGSESDEWTRIKSKEMFE